MAKTKISEFSSTPGNNTDIDSINIAEGCAPSGINDAIRELMAQLKDFQQGTAGDSFNGPVGTTTAAAGAFTTLAASGAVTLSGGTANGVPYLNGSKVLTTGSALTFDGSDLTLGNGVTLKIDNDDSITFGTFSLSTTGTLLTGGTSSSFLTYVGGALRQEITTTGVSIWRVAGSEQMRLTSTGLGIGTSSPSNLLTLNKTAGAYSLNLDGGGYGTLAKFGIVNVGVDNNSYIGSISNNNFLIKTYNNTVATFDTSGNLGLGVTPTTGGYGGGLQISRDPASNLLTLWTQPINTNDHRVSLTNNAKNTGVGTWAYNASSQSATMYQQMSGVHQWWTAGTGTAGNAISFTQAMTLDASGNLMVGTTTPTERLTVNGRIQSQWNNFVNGGATSYCGDATSLVTGASAGMWAARSDSALLFSISSTERARIDSSGNLLVGTTSSSSNSGNGFKVNVNIAGTGHTDPAIVTPQNSASYSCWDIYSTNTSSYRFYVTTTGVVNAVSTTITAISDQRLKENIRDLDDGLNIVMALKPRKFDWKAGKGADTKNARGFIAQEFEAVLPDLIDEWKDPAPEGEAPYKAVRADLIPTLVKAIQEQQAIIEDMKTRLAAAGI